MFRGWRIRLGGKLQCCGIEGRTDPRVRYARRMLQLPLCTAPRKHVRPRLFHRILYGSESGRLDCIDGIVQCSLVQVPRPSPEVQRLNLTLRKLARNPLGELEDLPDIYLGIQRRYDLRSGVRNAFKTLDMQLDDSARFISGQRGELISYPNAREQSRIEQHRTLAVDSNNGRPGLGEIRLLAPEERLTQAVLRCIDLGRLVAYPFAFHGSAHLPINDRSRCISGQPLESLDQGNGERPARNGHLRCIAELSLLCRLILLRCGEDQCRVDAALRGSGFGRIVSEHFRAFFDVSRVVSQRALFERLAHLHTAGEGAAVATIEKDCQLDALVECGMKDSMHPPIAHMRV